MFSSLFSRVSGQVSSVLRRPSLFSPRRPISTEDRLHETRLSKERVQRIRGQVEEEVKNPAVPFWVVPALGYMVFGWAMISFYSENPSPTFLTQEKVEKAKKELKQEALARAK